MAQELTTNFAVSTVATAPSPASSGTSLVVASGHGTRFPNPATQPFNAIVCPAAQQPTPDNAEIVRVTGKSTDTFTITRTQESTSARSIVVGDRIFAGVTAKTLSDLAADDLALFNAIVGRIQNSIVDAKGDLIAASANDTPVRFAAGANGLAPVYDSSQTSGLRAGQPLAGPSGYMTIAQTEGGIPAGTSAGNLAFASSGNPVATGSSMGSTILIYIDDAEWSISGLTTKMRVKSVLTTNATAPSIDFTSGLSAVTAVAGGANAVTYTFSAQTAGTTVTRSSPAASTRFVDYSSDFNVPTDGYYLLTCTTSGAMAATNPRVNVTLYLQLHYV